MSCRVRNVRSLLDAIQLLCPRELICRWGCWVGMETFQVWGRLYQKRIPLRRDKLPIVLLADCHWNFTSPSGRPGPSTHEAIPAPFPSSMHAPCTRVCIYEYASYVVRPKTQDRESSAMLAQQQADLVIIGVRIQGLVVLLVLHLIVRGLAGLPRVGLRGAWLRRALLPPLGAAVLEPNLQRKVLSSVSYFVDHGPYLNTCKTTPTQLV